MNELAEIRTRLGWSQTQMGERLGLHRNSVARLEEPGAADRLHVLAARMVALEEASRRGDLSVAYPLDVGLVESLTGIALRTREIRFAERSESVTGAVPVHPSFQKGKTK